MTFDPTIMKIEHCPYECSHLFVSEHFIHTHTCCVCVCLCVFYEQHQWKQLEPRVYLYYFSSNRRQTEQIASCKTARFGVLVSLKPKIGRNHSFSANVWKASDNVKSSPKFSQRNFKKSRLKWWWWDRRGASQRSQVCRRATIQRVQSLNSHNQSLCY